MAGNYHFVLHRVNGISRRSLSPYQAAGGVVQAAVADACDIRNRTMKKRDAKARSNKTGDAEKRCQHPL